MDVKNILAHCDHTLLKQESTWAQIKEFCDDGLKYGCASVCIPASFVKQAADYVGNELKICTVIGFPNGYSTTAVKVFETEDAIRNGADEIDMVINIGWVKDRRWDDLLSEIRAVKAACGGKLLKVIIETCLLTDEEKIKMCEIVSDSGADYIKTSTGFAGGGATREDVALFAKHVAPHVKIKAIKASCQGRILKVIVETCLLTEAEKIKLCELVTESGADYIKTSTGFSTGGATREDVALFKAHIGPGVKIKAAGGISSLQDAEDFMALGADRLGTSRIVKLVKGEHAEGY